MRVRDVMSSPVVTVPPDMPLKAVARLLVTRGLSAVPVWTAASWLPTRGAHLAPLPAAPVASRIASQAMTRDVVTLPAEADVADARRLMLERRIKPIPVVRGRRVIGIVARQDLLEVLARSDEEVTRDLEALLAAERGVPGVLEVRLDEEWRP